MADGLPRRTRPAATTSPPTLPAAALPRRTAPAPQRATDYAMPDPATRASPPAFGVWAPIVTGVGAGTLLLWSTYKGFQRATKAPDPPDTPKAAPKPSKHVTAGEAFRQPLPGARASVGSLALRAFGYATAMSLTAFSVGVIGVGWALDVKSPQEFTDKMLTVLPAKRESLQRSFGGLLDPVRRRVSESSQSSSSGGLAGPDENLSAADKQVLRDLEATLGLRSKPKPPASP